MFVLDCSVPMAWCFNDEGDAYASSVLECLKIQTAIVPQLWHLEVQNVLLTGERRDRLESHDSEEFLCRLLELDIQTDMTTNDISDNDVLALARQHQLSSYDAVYLGLAVREQLPLATLDKRLRKIAATYDLWLDTNT